MTTPPGFIHELVFTDREARPAKWQTRCGRTDVALERTMTPAPGSHYKITCPACARVAELEALADEMLAAFGERAVYDSDGALTRSAWIRVSEVATWRAIRNVGERAVAAADELSELGREIQGGEQS